MAVYNQGKENIIEFMRQAGDNISTDIAEKITDYDDLWEGKLDVAFTIAFRIIKERPLVVKDMKELRESLSGIDKHEKILKETINKGPLEKTEEPIYDIYLFYKDRNKALSLLEQLVANEHYQHGNIIEAKRFYQKSLEYNSKNGDSWLGLGLIDILEDNEKKGIAKCLKAEEINKKHYFGDIGLAFYRKGELEKTREWFKKDFSNKNTVVTAYNLGIIALKQDNIEQSVTWFNKSLEIDSQYWDSYIALGLLYEEVGKIDKAIKVLEKGMERIKDRNKEGKFFYKDEEKAKEMHSLLERLKGKRGEE